MDVSVIRASLINGPIIHKGYSQLYSEAPHGNASVVLAMLGGSPAVVV